MTITHETITALAPDQASLGAARKLMKPGKWPLRQIDEATGMVWGECQGSGANPYRTVFDKTDQGYKCTCPSRKFPCKHVLALMWMYVDGPAEFSPGTTPEWVSDWIGRRRKPAAGNKAEAPSSAGKSLAAAKKEEPAAPKDPKAEARAKAAAKKRAAETEASLIGAMDDLETWISDQLRTGLSGLLGDLTPRCRAIAARMVDGKAAALGGRLDELPAQLMALSGEERLDALVAHLGKLSLLARAFRADPQTPDLRRAVASSETREDILNNPESLRVQARWEVLGERIKTRRDGLVSQATWLMNLDGGEQAFALLLDFFPASVGKRGGAFASGDRFEAELVFYPGRAPLRAILAERKMIEGSTDWPAPPSDPLAWAMKREMDAPWEFVAPILLPEGRVVLTEAGKPWWQGGDLAFPLDSPAQEAALGMTLAQTAALWDGSRLSLLAAETDWGRIGFDA